MVTKLKYRLSLMSFVTFDLTANYRVDVVGGLVCIFNFVWDD